jgi:chaperonin GroEL
MKDNLHLSSQAKLKSGIEKVAIAVGGTMGTGGSNAILEAIESPGHLMTNDGYSIANAIVLADPIEDMGRKILLESINRANKASGDGSSTTCVLTADMIREGLKQKNVHPMDLKRQMEECLEQVEESLDEQTTLLVGEEGDLDLELLEQVATISAEDEEIGKMIAEIYSKIGPKGIVYWDVSKTAEDTYTIGQGITVEGAGWVTPYLCDADENGTNSNQIRLENPYILITKQKITSAADFNNIAETLNNKEVKDLIVFCDDIDPLVLPDLVNTRMVRGFRIIPVKLPTLWKDWWFEDLALATGATVVNPAAGLPMKDIKEEHLGRVGNIIVKKEDTDIDGIKDVSAHVAALEEQGDDDAMLRASRLNTKTGRYFVGAHSDSALSYRRLKVEDAIGAAYQALNGGIVCGGGVALRNISQALDGGMPGHDVVRDALLAVEKQVWSNVGKEYMELQNEEEGLDSRTREIVDMKKRGIIDPRNVVLNAIKNAISVSATVITAPTIVTLPREENVAQMPGNVAMR